MVVLMGLTRWSTLVGTCALGIASASVASGHLAARPRISTARPAAVVEVTAERFSFTPSELRTRMGQPIEIRLRSDDTDHGFKVIGTKIDVRIPKRGKGTATVTFDPPAAGRYTFECSHVCGAGHAFMRGVIVVTK
jgi:cytochrome c oxidase subunit 2